MNRDTQVIKFFRKRIPAFVCVPGCHDCCGPVLTSTVEMARLPRKTVQEQEAALEALSCPHLGADGCQVYEERPLVCRLFGTTPKLACPNGKRPRVMIDPLIEEQIFSFFSQTRHVLV
ncbi:MAG: YkgJ family cysteine cluster protein [Collimonas sp.]|uniref:YkgJ family cysteine cluster protein n=1 Tax=Collimonas sp. TaxID=1963772 RepID=UPI0032646091